MQVMQPVFAFRSSDGLPSLDHMSTLSSYVHASLLMRCWKVKLVCDACHCMHTAPVLCLSAELLLLAHGISNLVLNKPSEGTAG